MRKNINFKEKVVDDYRERIIINKDNPILAFKALRDRYSPQHGKLSGKPYLASNASEDALTWNVFRILYERKKLGYLFKDYELGRIRSLALWCLTPDTKHQNKQFQFDMGNAIRTHDGVLGGETSEPDVAILGSKGLCIIECKLGSPNQSLSHPWKGPWSSIEKRIPVYKKEITEFGTFLEKKSEDYYQLIRMAFYAMVLSRRYGVAPHLVSLINKHNWTKGTPPAEKTWNDFCSMTRGVLPKLILHTLFWQDLIEIPELKKIDSLYRYLKSHPRLFPQQNPV